MAPLASGGIGGGKDTESAKTRSLLVVGVDKVEAAAGRCVGGTLRGGGGTRGGGHQFWWRFF